MKGNCLSGIGLTDRFEHPILTDFILSRQVDFVEIVRFLKYEAVDTEKRTINAQMILNDQPFPSMSKPKLFDLLLTSVGVAVVSSLQ